MTVTKTIWFDNYTDSREAFLAILNRASGSNQEAIHSHGAESITLNIGTEDEVKLKFRTRTGKSGPR